jgi:hypothetical protein
MRAPLFCFSCTVSLRRQPLQVVSLVARSCCFMLTSALAQFMQFMQICSAGGRLTSPYDGRDRFQSWGGHSLCGAHILSGLPLLHALRSRRSSEDDHMTARLHLPERRGWPESFCVWRMAGNSPHFWLRRVSYCWTELRACGKWPNCIHIEVHVCPSRRPPPCCLHPRSIGRGRKSLLRNCPEVP